MSQVAPARPESPWKMLLGFGVGLALVVTGVLWLVITTANAASAPPPGAATASLDPRIGKEVEFTLFDMAGNSVKVSDFRGRPVIINLWASWCPPCKAELPELMAFYRQYESTGLVVLAVDTEDEMEAAARFIADWQMPFTVLWDPEATVLEQLKARGLPTTYVLDRNGILRQVWNGQLMKTTLDQQIAPLVMQ
ncbi:MAG: TlpA family protein disulfide reductase [Chloroflexi bacterium]|nr:TlpA family protein disulfide reductase [Chloroflexota bacterium]